MYKDIAMCIFSTLYAGIYETCRLLSQDEVLRCLP